MSTDTQLAVVGMSGRFPGAGDLAGFWRNLADGVESIAALPGTAGSANRAACGLLADPDSFDAEFFGYAPRDALLIDPQHRVFLECAWEALEHAGYDPARYPGRIGVYAGCSQTGYAQLLQSRRDSELLADVGDFALRLGSGVDFLTTRVAYKLGLRGPAVTVLTACSTSLVAIHLAGQALLTGECDMALAGGVTVHVPAYPGEYSQDGILSADGHCRAFDAKADGTVGGDGAGVVVLKRLADAEEDRDTVHAVMLASAVNNDGADKIGYTAPSVTGQADAVLTALRLAEVPPDTVTYLEAHGTGTPVGDPIEVAALASAFRAGGSRTGPAEETVRCWIGSVKTNIGHLDAAAGVAGFLKVVLSLQHRQLPASLHFQHANPAIDFPATRFAVNTRLRTWVALPGTPRRAGVNSMGIGGTNAHVVLQEVPPAAGPPAAGPAAGGPAAGGRRWRLVPVSARNRRALDRLSAALAEQVATRPPPPGPGAEPAAVRAAEAAEPAPELASVAWTLQVGRRQHAHRRFAVVADLAELPAALASTDRPTAVAERDRLPIAFLFPGQGGQRAGMTRQLYTHEPAFRESVDDCARQFAGPLRADLREVLCGAPSPANAALMQEMAMAQACVFTVEYALAGLWSRWGVVPDAVVGHSLGAYAAACVAGVLDLPAAVRLVATRGRLLQGLPAGAMVAVPLPEIELRSLLGPALALAAVNSPDQCVVSGPREAVDALLARLDRRGVTARRLRVSAAAHSVLVDPVMPAFQEVVAAIRLAAPVIPIVSDRTGQWLTAEQARDPAYWAGHLRGTVRFGGALTTLLHWAPRALLVEVGPGRTLASLARQHPGHDARGPVLTSLPHPSHDQPELAHLLDAAGRVWLTGHDLDWAGLNQGEGHRRVPLPTYPFQRTRYRIGPDRREPVRIEPTEPDQPGADGDRADDRYVPPGSETEQAVAAAFGQILGVPRVGARDSFLDLGGDSLIAAQLTAWVRRRYGVPVSTRSVLRAPTVAALAEIIDSLQQTTTPAEEPSRVR